MTLTREQVEHVAHLARLSLTDKEIERYHEQLSAVLDYAETLNDLDTTAIPPTASVLPLHTVLRADEPQPSLSPDDILANAPNRDGQFFRVHAILEWTRGGAQTAEVSITRTSAICAPPRRPSLRHRTTLTLSSPYSSPYELPRVLSTDQK